MNINSQIVLQRCDITNLWKGSNSITSDFAEKKEGKASISCTGSGTDWFKKSFSQTDVGIDESGWFSFWLYVSDVSQFNGDGQIELTSSGGPDNNEYSWPISGVGLINGWNSVELQLSSANKTGSPSLDSINFFRIYQFLSGEITAKIDFLRFTTSQNPVSPADPLDIPELDYTTLDGKVMFGYQGWFFHPDDGSTLAQWKHWGELQDANTIEVEMFPDMREYEPDEKLESGLTYTDGRIARVYSAYTKKTVIRHMKWLRDYSLDGVFLQRFIVSLNDAKLREALDTVTINVMAGCEKYDRAFVNMWDLSGMGPGEMSKVINDWKHLVDDLKITESPNYLHHRGKPLVSIWGFTVRDLPATDLQELIDFFRDSPEEKYRATIMLGTNHDFFQQASWLDELRQVDVISPWAVGRFNSTNGNQNFINNYVIPGQDWCDQNNIDFLPVIWPGFSWYNLKGEGTWQKNQIPRDGGNFYWTQSNRTISSNAKMVYIAMFDEVDEATAMYKLAENKEQVPAIGYWLPLDEDGYDLPSDWYLRCVKLTTEVVKGETENRSSLDTPPDGIDAFRAEALSAKCDATMGKLSFWYPEVYADSLLEFSIDGGISYPYPTPVGSSFIETEPLSSGIYNVWVRRSDGSFPTDLGPHTIFDLWPDASIKTTDATCGFDDGVITLTMGDNPYLGPLQFSIDGGSSYDTTTTDGTWAYDLEGFGSGSYSVWSRWADGNCPQHLEDVTIGSKPIEISLFPTVDGEPLGQTETVVRACQGSSLSISAEPAEDSWTWSWTGQNDFSASTRSVLISDSVTGEMYGRYEVTYISTEGCEDYAYFYIRTESDCQTIHSDDIYTGSGLRAFPNPTCGPVRFEAGQAEIKSIEISDLSGRQVIHRINLSSEGNTIDLSSFEHGVYIYRMEDNEGNNRYGRIIKE
ncbi:MAG: hypothetical protein A2Y71_07785 [Bacteroidetes bacterium RBG_13_42_15]|nr:MAG: hypothetical protein A2Y71_07785 [Bacteroidetes bacterium RBG_13_42_15]